MSDSLPPLLETLAQAADGLLFPSETDAPLEPFFWPAPSPAPLTPAAVLELGGYKPDTPVKKVKLETFFRSAVQEEEWHNDDEKATVARFKELLRVLKSELKDAAAYRVGETKLDVYVVGMVDGGYAGVKTQVVET